MLYYEERQSDHESTDSDARFDATDAKVGAKFDAQDAKFRSQIDGLRYWAWGPILVVIAAAVATILTIFSSLRGPQIALDNGSRRDEDLAHMSTIFLPCGQLRTRFP